MDGGHAARRDGVTEEVPADEGAPLRPARADDKHLPSPGLESIGKNGTGHPSLAPFQAQSLVLTPSAYFYSYGRTVATYPVTGGSMSVTIYNGNINVAAGIVTDGTDVYWTTFPATQEIIAKATVAGGADTTLYTLANTDPSIAVDNDSVFWFESQILMRGDK